MSRVKLNKAVVAALDYAKDGQWVTDTEVPQLVVRLSETARTYVCRWTSSASANGKRKQEVIGPVGSLSVDEAREAARKIVAKDRPGGAQTLGDIFDIWQDQYASQIGVQHAAEFERGWKLHLAPTFAKKKLSRLTHAEVQRWYSQKMKEHPTDKDGNPRDKTYAAATVNRWVAYLSKLCAIARKLGHMTGNPTEGLEKSTNNRRVTIFTRDDVKDVADNLDAMKEKRPQGVALLRFLMTYPCRGIEARRMQWDWLDLEAGTWTIPGEYYKSKQPKVFPLGPLQINFLKNLRDNHKWSETWVFPAPSDFTRQISKDYQKKTWNKVRPKPLGAHTLRKTIASAMLNDDMPLEIVSKLLGHSSTLVTQQIYAHLAPATAARHLAQWSAILEDDLEEPEASELDVVLKGQHDMAVTREYQDAAEQAPAGIDADALRQLG